MMIYVLIYAAIQFLVLVGYIASIKRMPNPNPHVGKDVEYIDCHSAEEDWERVKKVGDGYYIHQPIGHVEIVSENES